MTPDIAILLAILFAALILFSFEWVSVDIVALGVLLALILTGLLPPEQAFAGFGSDTVILILGLLILTAALVRTGVVEMTGRWIMQYSGDSPTRALNVVTVAAATMSAFMSNTASTAFFLPIVIGLARRAKVSASKLLMPLAFAAILASSVTPNRNFHQYRRERPDDPVRDGAAGHVRAGASGPPYRCSRDPLHAVDRAPVDSRPE
jgi:di/tricarboxylate transporter